MNEPFLILATVADRAPIIIWGAGTAAGEAAPAVGTGDGAWWFDDEDNSHHILTAGL